MHTHVGTIDEVVGAEGRVPIHVDFKGGFRQGFCWRLFQKPKRSVSEQSFGLACVVVNVRSGHSRQISYAQKLVLDLDIFGWGGWFVRCEGGKESEQENVE